MPTATLEVVTNCQFCRGPMVKSEGGNPGANTIRVQCKNCGTKGNYDPETRKISGIELPDG